MILHLIWNTFHQFTYKLSVKPLSGFYTLQSHLERAIKILWCRFWPWDASLRSILLDNLCRCDPVGDLLSLWVIPTLLSYWAECCGTSLCLVWFQKQLSSVVNTAQCGLDTRLGPCVLHGVLRSNTSPPHYRPDGSFCTAHTLHFYTLPKQGIAVCKASFFLRYSETLAAQMFSWNVFDIYFLLLF